MDVQERLQSALEEHLAASGGGFVRSWHLVADIIDDEGDQAWLYAVADGQQQITTLGLLEWARGIARYEQAAYLSSSEFDDGECD
jgi:hypothetical protein